MVHRVQYLLGFQQRRHQRLAPHAVLSFANIEHDVPSITAVETRDQPARPPDAGDYMPTPLQKARYCVDRGPTVELSELLRRQILRGPVLHRVVGEADPHDTRARNGYPRRSATAVAHNVRTRVRLARIGGGRVAMDGERIARRADQELAAGRGDIAPWRPGYRRLGSNPAIPGRRP